MTFEFTDRQEDQCTVALKWENLSIPFVVSLPSSKEIYASHIMEQMQGVTGFNWTTRNQAANYMLQNDIYLEEALAWQELTVSNPFFGNENVTTLRTMAGLLMKLGNTEDAIATIDKAANLSSATVFQVHQIGRQLLQKEEDIN